jgi:hypothetical protein
MDPTEKLLCDLQAWARAKYGRPAFLARKLGVSRQLDHPPAYTYAPRRAHPGISEKTGKTPKEKRFVKDIRKALIPGQAAPTPDQTEDPVPHARTINTF